MLTAMGVSAVAFTLLFFYLMGRRMALERMRDEVEEIREQIESRRLESLEA